MQDEDRHEKEDEEAIRRAGLQSMKTSTTERTIKIVPSWIRTYIFFRLRRPISSPVKWHGPPLTSLALTMARPVSAQKGFCVGLWRKVAVWPPIVSGRAPDQRMLWGTVRYNFEGE